MQVLLIHQTRFQLWTAQPVGVAPRRSPNSLWCELALAWRGSRPAAPPLSNLREGARMATGSWAWHLGWMRHSHRLQHIAGRRFHQAVPLRTAPQDILHHVAIETPSPCLCATVCGRRGACARTHSSFDDQRLAATDYLDRRSVGHAASVLVIPVVRVPPGPRRALATPYNGVDAIGGRCRSSQESQGAS